MSQRTPAEVALYQDLNVSAQDLILQLRTERESLLARYQPDAQPVREIDAKIAQLQQLQSKITALLQQRDDAQKAQIAALVKTYGAMKAKDAARIFNTLPDDVLMPVAQEMKSDMLAPVMAAMNPENAQKLTVKLANRLTLPQTTDVPAPVAAPQEAAAAPAPGAPAAATQAATAPPAQPETAEKPKT